MFGDSKYEVLIRNIKEFIETGRYPIISGDGATGRTETRFAGVRYGKCFTTIKTFVFVEA